MKKCKYGKIGEKYGRLTIIGEAEPRIYPNGNKARRVLVQCDCNSEPFEVRLDHLRSGNTTSCGCVQKEKVKETHKKTNTYDLSGEYGKGYTSKGEEFLFDLEDFDKIKEYYWLIDKHGYVTAHGIDTKKTIKFHRLVMNAKEGMDIDHIYHDKTDNRKENLREVTRSQNQMNRRITKINTSGVIGVHFNKARNKWQAYITINGKLKYLGLFENLEDAIQARLKAELELYGTFSPNYEKLTQQSDQQSQQNTQ